MYFPVDRNIREKQLNSKKFGENMTTSIVDYFISLVKIDSESKNEKLIAEKLKHDLEELGAKVEIDNSAERIGSNTGNIIAYFDGEISKKPIMFCAHMDTVKPGNGIKPQIKEDRIITDGTTILGSDDKSGIAEIIWAIKELKEENEKTAPFEILFTVCEEIGLLGAKNVDPKKFKSEIGFALDSHKVGEITNQAPYQNSMKFTIFGKEAHAGVEPEKGINAIKIAAVAISNMKIGRIDDETTCNIGIIEGGKATNIVPNKVVIKAEVRSHNLEKLENVTKRMKSAFDKAAKLYNSSIEAIIVREYNAFKIEKNNIVVELAKNAADNLNIKFKTVIGGGGSDANILNLKGMEMVIAGSGMSAVHTVEEYILIKELEDGAKWVNEIIKIYSKQQ